MLTIPGSSIRLPADAIDTNPTLYPSAWLGMLLTVRLYDAIDGVRFARHERGLLSEWFARNVRISMSPLEFAKLYAIPLKYNEKQPPLKHAGLWTLHRGTVLNVGRCGPLDIFPGGGFQAEFLSGPLPTIRHRRDL